MKCNELTLINDFSDLPETEANGKTKKEAEKPT
jgi:hypothetical protein